MYIKKVERLSFSFYNQIMFRIAICEDEKVVLDFEASLVNKWAAGRGCSLELDAYISAEQFLFESEDKIY